MEKKEIKIKVLQPTVINVSNPSEEQMGDNGWRVPTKTDINKMHNAIAGVPTKDLNNLGRTVRYLNSPAHEEVFLEGSDDGLDLDLADARQNEIVSETELGAVVLKEKLRSKDWDKLCIHHDALYFRNCLCYNSKFCRTECDYRNKTPKP